MTKRTSQTDILGLPEPQRTLRLAGLTEDETSKVVADCRASGLTADTLVRLLSKRPTRMVIHLGRSGKPALHKALQKARRHGP
jgi:hypothetical protein